MQISFIGSGHIAELLINRLLETRFCASSDIVISDPDKKRLKELQAKFNVEAASDNISALRSCDIAFICVQPHVAQNIIDELSGENCDKIIISVSAGISIGAYTKAAPRATVARILPNPPSAVGMGAVPVAVSENAATEQIKTISDAVSVFGKIFFVSEDKIDIFTSITSPAPALTFFETMVDAAVLCGLDRETSLKVVFQTMAGCLKMWEEYGLHEVVTASCTPAGTSVESLRVLDKMNFRACVKEAYVAAFEKSRSFGEK